MILTADHLKLINDYLGGKPVSDIAEDRNQSRYTIYQNLRQPDVRAEIDRRLASLADRAIKFKLDAFDAAEHGLAKLANLSQLAKTEELQRLASLDCVKISGLMPRRRVLVEMNQMNGVDEDTRDWLEQVIHEVKQAPRVLEGA